MRTIKTKWSVMRVGNLFFQDAREFDTLQDAQEEARKRIARTYWLERGLRTDEMRKGCEIDFEILQESEITTTRENGTSFVRNQEEEIRGSYLYVYDWGAHKDEQIPNPQIFPGKPLNLVKWFVPRVISADALKNLDRADEIKVEGEFKSYGFALARAKMDIRQALSNGKHRPKEGFLCIVSKSDGSDWYEQAILAERLGEYNQSIEYAIEECTPKKMIFEMSGYNELDNYMRANPTMSPAYKAKIEIDKDHDEPEMEIEP